MRLVNKQVVGQSDFHFRGEEVDTIIHQCTSEHDGSIHVVIVLGEFKFGNVKQPFIFNEELYLAVYMANCVLISDDNSLNIRELIFMFDNAILTYDDMGIDVNLNGYL